MKLEELLADFDGADPEEALEMLIELSETLPPVSATRAATPRSGECRIQECQTPVDLWTDLISGQVFLEAVVPEKSPTVRGFVALLVTGLKGATPEEVLAMPDDFLPRLGLAETLGMTRQRGFHGIVARIKQDVSRAQSRGVSPGVSAPIR
ncbi:MAG TPA: SufE family protein [Planctomycetaceae bacterium]|nr:SufE family protein [Planctomycetaceae bacterium]